MNIPTRVTGGAERPMLEYMLDHTRAELIGTVRGLSETESRRRLVPSMTTSIGLVKHAAFAERKWFQHILGGLPESECDGAMVGEASFVVSDNETVADVIGEFERASNRARAIAADIDLDATRQHPSCGTVSLRWIYLLMIQEFARHAGHNDILREQTGAPPVELEPDRQIPPRQPHDGPNQLRRRTHRSRSRTGTLGCCRCSSRCSRWSRNYRC